MFKFDLELAKISIYNIYKHIKITQIKNNSRSSDYRTSLTFFWGINDSASHPMICPFKLALQTILKKKWLNLYYQS